MLISIYMNIRVIFMNLLELVDIPSVYADFNVTTNSFGNYFSLKIKANETLYFFYKIGTCSKIVTRNLYCILGTFSNI